MYYIYLYTYKDGGYSEKIYWFLYRALLSHILWKTVPHYAYLFHLPSSSIPPTYIFKLVVVRNTSSFLFIHTLLYTCTYFLYKCPLSLLVTFNFLLYFYFSFSFTFSNVIYIFMALYLALIIFMRHQWERELWKLSMKK